MDQHELHNLKQWFSDYCRSFYSGNHTDQRNIVLKEKHTEQVCRNMDEIARSLRLSPEHAALAGTIALLHDVGRFPQYQRFRTFQDGISTNHAALGAAVLIENNVLANLPEHERNIVVRSVTLHNVFSLPERVDEETRRFTNMVRDADKLDIWRVFIDYYRTPVDARPDAVALGLPDDPGYSPEVLASLARRELVTLSMLRTLNDFKLLQLAWIFDLNFGRSLELVRERAIIENLAASLPVSEDISRAVEDVRRSVEERLRKDS